MVTTPLEDIEVILALKSSSDLVSFILSSCFVLSFYYAVKLEDDEELSLSDCDEFPSVKEELLFVVLLPLLLELLVLLPLLLLLELLLLLFPSTFILK